MIRFSDYITEINESIESDTYLKNSVNEAKAEVRKMIFESGTLFESNNDESLEFEFRLMQEKTKNIDLNTPLAKQAKFVAMLETKYVSYQYAQIAFFNTLYEAAHIHETASDVALVGAAAKIMSDLKQINKTLVSLTKVIRDNSSDLDNMRAVTLLRKARASGDVNQIIDALAGVMTVIVGGTSADLSSKAE